MMNSISTTPTNAKQSGIGYAHVYVAGYLLFTLNLETVFHVPQFVLVTKIVMMVGAILGLIGAKKLLVPFLCASAVLFITFFSGVFTSYPYFSWGNWIRALNQLFVPLALLCISPNRRDAALILASFAAAPLVCFLAGCIYDLAGLRKLFSAEYGSGILRLQGALIPAFMGAISVGGSVASLLLWISGRKRWLYIFVINSMFLVLTAARMPIAVWVLIVGYLLLFQVRLAPLHKIGFITLLLGGGLAFLFIFGDSLLARAGTSGTSGRDILWRHYELLIKTYPDFGVGFGNSILTVPHQTSIQVGGVVAAHNEFLRIPAEVGVIPAALIITLFIIMMTARWIRLGAGNALIPISTAAFLLYCYSDNSVATPSNYPIVVVAVLGSMIMVGTNKSTRTAQRTNPSRRILKVRARPEAGADQ